MLYSEYWYWYLVLVLHSYIVKASVKTLS
jgi:hypothetical protein